MTDSRQDNLSEGRCRQLESPGELGQTNENPETALAEHIGGPGFTSRIAGPAVFAQGPDDGGVAGDRHGQAELIEKLGIGGPEDGFLFASWAPTSAAGRTASPSSSILSRIRRHASVEISAGRWLSKPLESRPPARTERFENFVMT